jgi:hypothetical protein
VRTRRTCRADRARCGRDPRRRRGRGETRGDRRPTRRPNSGLASSTRFPVKPHASNVCSRG